MNQEIRLSEIAFWGKPKNPKRESLAKDLVTLVGKGQTNRAEKTDLNLKFIDSNQPDKLKSFLDTSQAKLLLANAEDLPAELRADGKQLFVGLLCKEFPKSQSLLDSLNSNVSFYIHEDSSIESLREPLQDLLI